MRYLVVNGTGYGLGDTLRGAIDAYRDAVRPGAQYDYWQVGIAPDGDRWKHARVSFITAKGGEPTVFELDLR